MINHLTTFLRALASDPAALAQFQAAPAAAMQAAGLSESEQKILLAAQARFAGASPAAIKTAIGAALQNDPTLRIDERLGGMERVFRAPPLTPELVAAIKLIAPQYDFAADEASRATWEADQNGTCWGEYEALAPLFRSQPRPRTILEIGPGMGRSLVFFSKKLGWEESTIHAYEGEGSTTKYTLLGPRFQHSFCGTIPMLRHVLEYNGMHNVTIFNAQDMPLADLPGPYDFLYSFYAIGFHWSLEYFLDDLLPLLHERSIAVFTVPTTFTPFAKLKTLPYRLIDWKTAWPSNGVLRLLVIGRETAERIGDRG